MPEREKGTKVCETVETEHHSWRMMKRRCSMAREQISIMARGEPVQIYPERQQPVESLCWSRGKVWEVTAQPRVGRGIGTEGVDLIQGKGAV